MASTGATSCQHVSASGSECRTVTQAAMKRSLKMMKTATTAMGIGTKGSPCQPDPCVVDKNKFNAKRCTRHRQREQRHVGVSGSNEHDGPQSTAPQHGSQEEKGF